jgi:hypothetical protein
VTRPRVERRYGALVLVSGQTEYVVRREAARLLLDADQVVDVRVLGGPTEAVGKAYPRQDGTIAFALPGQVVLHFGRDHLRALEILPDGAAARALLEAEA